MMPKTQLPVTSTSGLASSGGYHLVPCSGDSAGQQDVCSSFGPVVGGDDSGRDGYEDAHVSWRLGD